MGRLLLVACVAAASAAAIVQPARAQLNNQPYSYRSTDGAGMSTAYRQAILDRELTGSRPRNLLRGSDGNLVTVIERNGQAFAAERQPNIFVGRGPDAPLAGVRLHAGGAGAAVAIDGWTAMVDTITPLD